MGIDRSKKIFELRVFKRMTYRQLGEVFGISGERVNQIIRKCYRIFCVALDRQERLLKIKNIPLEAPKEYFITLNDLSVRTRMALLAANIKEFEDLAKYRSREILSLRQIGKKGLTEITNLMRLRGISFRDDGSFHGGVGCAGQARRRLSVISNFKNVMSCPFEGF